MKNAIIICFFLLSATLSFAQYKIIIQVSDAETKEKLQGVSVSIVKTKQGGTTDSTGKIVLRDIPGGRQQINISSVGYTEVTLT